MAEERYKTFTKKRIAFCAAVVLFAAVIGLLVANHDSTPMPAYQGKTAREWMYYAVSTRDSAERRDAFRHMGSNAVPFLVHEMTRRETLWEKARGWIRPKLPNQVSKHISWPVASVVRLRCAAFGLLNVHSRTAVPAVLKFAVEGNEDERFYALLFLDSVLKETDTNWVPQLMMCLKSNESENSIFVAEMLVKLHSGELAIPTLTNLLVADPLRYSTDASNFLEVIDPKNATKWREMMPDRQSTQGSQPTNAPK